MAHQQLYDLLAWVRDGNLNPENPDLPFPSNKPTHWRLKTPNSFVAMYWDPCFGMSSRTYPRWTFVAESPSCPRVTKSHGTQQSTDAAIYDFLQCLPDDEAEALVAGQTWAGRRPSRMSAYIPQTSNPAPLAAVQNVVRTANQTIFAGLPTNRAFYGGALPPR